MIIDTIKNINNDCDFTSSIIESSLVEKPKKVSKQYYNFLFCILDNYDLILSSASEKEKKCLFKKRLLDISSKIDEESSKYYDNFGYNSKTMKKKCIQNSLHDSMENSKNISSIYFFNDLYKIHFVIVDLNKNEYYETTKKDYEKIYLCFKKNTFFLKDELPGIVAKMDISDSIFNIDVKNIYKTYLESFCKYKIYDLRNIAINLDISIDIANKKTTKKQLYDEINTKMMN